MQYISTPQTPNSILLELFRYRYFYNFVFFIPLNILFISNALITSQSPILDMMAREGLFLKATCQ